MESIDDGRPLGADGELPDEQHAALCALALGELIGEPAVELRARIEREPALAAQFEEVQGTIQLVRSSLGGAEARSTGSLPGEALSAAHIERLLQGARAVADDGERASGQVSSGHVSGEMGRVIELAWYRRPAVRLAASVTLVAGAGLFALQALKSDTSGVRVAREDSSIVENDLEPTGSARRLEAAQEYVAVAGGVVDVSRASFTRDAARLPMELGDVTTGLEMPSLELAEARVKQSVIGIGGGGGAPQTKAPEPVTTGTVDGGSAGVFHLGQPPAIEAARAAAPNAPMPPVGGSGGGSAAGFLPTRPPSSGPSSPGSATRGHATSDSLGLAPAQKSDIDGAAEAPSATGGLVVEDEMVKRLRGYTSDFDVEAGGRITDAELARRVDERWEQLQRECRRMPQERLGDMYFRFWGDNAFVRTGQDALSTFGADVDTASYALARRYLRDGLAPERAQIRTEEFVNAFTPDLPAPTEETFGLHLELAPTPFGTDSNHWLLRVGVRGKEISKNEREPLCLTFVIDTSGSMREGGRLELVKHALRLLVTQLEARDTLAIVAYSSDARQILAPTSAAHRDLIESALYPLAPNGSTNAEAGLRMGYALAATMLVPGTHNRVVFLSDGVANMGQTDQDRINSDIRRFREQGIFLNTIGVGMGNHNDVFLEQLANKGDGICDYIDDAKAAEKAIVERFSGAFVPIASDVKLQVEFEPSQVLQWRQLGYENRAIADQDFRNDKVDAGELGAGHQVTCLYEVELVGELTKMDPARALATLRVRWKAPKVARQDPAEIDIFEREATLGCGAAAGSFRAATAGFRRSALAAQFAEFLRRSTHAREDSYTALVAELGALIDASPRVSERDRVALDELTELGDLVRRADGLGFGRRAPVAELDRVIDEYRRYRYLRETMREVHQDEAPPLRQVENMNRRLEKQIRDALRRNLSERHG